MRENVLKVFLFIQFQDEKNSRILKTDIYKVWVYGNFNWANVWLNKIQAFLCVF